VPHQAEQRHRRRLDRTAGQLIGVQALTLQLQGETLTTQELDQCRPLIAE